MIIGFHGRLGSGKDTAAERLAQIVDCDTEFVSFAGKLKASAAALFGIPVESWQEWKNDPDVRFVVEHKKAPTRHIADLSAREILQRYGTEAHRDIFGDNFWVDQALGDPPMSQGLANMMYMKHELTLVTDARFPNELEGIQERMGVVVELIGKDDPEVYKIQGQWFYTDDGAPVHPSEYPLEGCDYTIDNTSRYDDFANLDKQLYDLAIKLGLPLRAAKMSEQR